MTEPRNPREFWITQDDHGHVETKEPTDWRKDARHWVHVREVMEDSQICDLCSHDNTANALECSHLEEKLDRTQRALTKAKSSLPRQLHTAVEALEKIKNEFEPDWKECQEIAREALKSIKGLE